MHKRIGRTFLACEQLISHRISRAMVGGGGLLDLHLICLFGWYQNECIPCKACKASQDNNKLDPALLTLINAINVTVIFSQFRGISGCRCWQLFPRINTASKQQQFSLSLYILRTKYFFIMNKAWLNISKEIILFWQLIYLFAFFKEFNQ